MSSYQPTYIGEIELNEDTLAHYGIKGMKWGRRLRSALKNNPIARRRRHNRYVASHIARDIDDGRMITIRTNVTTSDKYGRRRNTTGLFGKESGVIVNRDKNKVSVKTVENHKAPNGANVLYGRNNTTTSKALEEALSSLNRRKKKK